MKLHFTPAVGMTLSAIDRPGHTCVILHLGRSKLRGPDRTKMDQNLRVHDHTGDYDSVASCWRPFPIVQSSDPWLTL